MIYSTRIKLGFVFRSFKLLNCRLLNTTNLSLQQELRTRNLKVKNLDLSEFSTDKIRNFCILAHIDHGKLSFIFLHFLIHIIRKTTFQNKSQVNQRLAIDF